MKNFYMLLIPFSIFMAGDLSAMDSKQDQFEEKIVGITPKPFVSESFALSHQVAKLAFEGNSSVSFTNILELILKDPETDESVGVTAKMIDDLLKTSNSKVLRIVEKIEQIIKTKIEQIIETKEEEIEKKELVISVLKSKLMGYVQQLIEYAENLSCDSSDGNDSH